MEVHIGSEQFFVNLSPDSLWIRDLDSKNSRVIVGGSSLEDSSAQFQGGLVTVSGTEILLVMPVRRTPKADEQSRVVDLLQAQLIGVPVAFVIEEEVGRAVVEAADDLAAKVASAVAVMKASWAWDESDSFSVTVNGAEWVVEPHYDGRTWRT